MISLSLLGPLRARVFGTPTRDYTPQGRTTRKFPSWGFITVVGAFCAGIGMGFMFSSS
jgi:hypothetical protein